MALRNLTAYARPAEATRATRATIRARPVDASPLSIRDVDKALEESPRTDDVDLDAHLPLRDPCPSCGAFRLTVGDYICTGVCDACIDYLFLTQEET